MTLVVPYDGTELSQAALVRATQFDQILDGGIVAVTVIPNNNTTYAAERDWLRLDESFSPETIYTRLKEEVAEISPEATFEYIVVGKYAKSGQIASKLRNFAKYRDAGIVFIGSENAGRLVHTVSSVGGTVAADRAYDTMIINTVAPTPIEKLEESLPTEEAIDQ